MFEWIVSARYQTIRGLFALLSVSRAGLCCLVSISEMLANLPVVKSPVYPIVVLRGGKFHEFIFDTDIY